MAGKRLPRCRYCGCKFEPDPYNRHHQEYCSRPACRTEHDRARKRKHYRERLDREEGFREAERERCRKAMRRLRAERKKAAKGAGQEAFCLLSVPPVEAFLAGLVSQLADTIDPRALFSTRICSPRLSPRGEPREIRLM